MAVKILCYSFQGYDTLKSGNWLPNSGVKWYIQLYLPKCNGVVNLKTRVDFVVKKIPRINKENVSCNVNLNIHP